MLNWLLIFVPVTIALEFLMPGAHTIIFIAACLAIVPLAGWLGHATEELAHHTGEGVGGLLNATFGNAAELIIAIMALRQGVRLESVQVRRDGWRALCMHSQKG